MTIVHIFPYSARVPGGHSNAIREFIRSQRKAGLEAFGISPTQAETAEGGTDLGEWICELPFDTSTRIFSRIDELTRGKPAILHLHAVDRWTTALAAQAKSHGLTVVLTSHGQLNCRSFWHGLKKAVYLALFPSPIRHLAGIQVLTERERGQLHWMIPWFRRPIMVIPHVVDHPIRDAGSGELPSIGKEISIVHLGRLDVHTKGLDLLLDAFANAKLEPARLVLAGPDWNGGRARLEEAAQGFGCADRVEFPGPVYGEAKERLLESADLFVASSRWDAFNLSLAEAMVRGVPALVSDRLNLAPALAANDAAEVTRCNVKSLASALQRLVADSARRKHLACRGRQWVAAHCSSEAVGAEFMAFYQIR